MFLTFNDWLSIQFVKPYKPCDKVFYRYAVFYLFIKMSVVSKQSILFDFLFCRSCFTTYGTRYCSSEFSNVLFSHEEKKNCIERLKNIKIRHSLPSSASQKNASVLIPLCLVNNEMSLLYTLRKQDLKRHKGQVSFPGGRQDSGDSNLEITALRETKEEIGICQSSVDVWGHGNAIVAREFNIYPVVGFIGNIDIDNLKINPSEVDMAFSIPLKHLCDPQNFRYTQYRNGSGYSLPVFINGKFKIWGITALITHIFLQSLIPKRYKAGNVLRVIKPVI